VGTPPYTPPSGCLGWASPDGAAISGTGLAYTSLLELGSTQDISIHIPPPGENPDTHMEGQESVRGQMPDLSHTRPPAWQLTGGLLAQLRRRLAAVNVVSSSLGLDSVLTLDNPTDAIFR